MNYVNVTNANLFPFRVISKELHKKDDITWAFDTFGESGVKFTPFMMIDLDCRWIHMPFLRAARFKTESDAILFKLRFA